MTVRELNWFERLLQKWFPYAIIPICLLLVGCGHNTSMVFSGFEAKAGMDVHNNYTPVISVTDGLRIADISRENSFWIVEIDSVSGITIGKDGTIKGVKSFRRFVGPQVNGYSVKLAETNPTLAAEYAKAMQEFWRAVDACSRN